MMTDNIISFPLQPGRSVGYGADPYPFWFDILSPMPRRRRERLIHQAYLLGLIDERDREIFLAAWPQQMGRR
jgi:hypothetical protein